MVLLMMLVIVMATFSMSVAYAEETAHLVLVVQMQVHVTMKERL
jgi:hypothetical protein